MCGVRKGTFEESSLPGLCGNTFAGIGRRVLCGQPVAAGRTVSSQVVGTSGRTNPRTDTIEGVSGETCWRAQRSDTIVVSGGHCGIDRHRSLERLCANRTTADPAAIAVPPAGDLQLVEVAVNPQLHTGATVRWGGNVIQVDHDSAGNALIQVIERRLDTDGRPIEGSTSDGRFMISATADVDPRFYSRDRLLTVAGTINGGVSANVGDTALTMPVVQVSEFMVWEPHWRNDPYWGPYQDPYWDPYWAPYWGPYWGPYRSWYGPRFGFGVGAGYRRDHYRRRY